MTHMVQLMHHSCITGETVTQHCLHVNSAELSNYAQLIDCCS